MSAAAQSLSCDGRQRQLRLEQRRMGAPRKRSAAHRAKHNNRRRHDHADSQDESDEFWVEPAAKTQRPRPSCRPSVAPHLQYGAPPPPPKPPPFVPSRAPQFTGDRPPPPSSSRPSFTPRALRPTGSEDALDDGMDSRTQNEGLGAPAFGLDGPAYAEIEVLVPVPKALIPKVIGKAASTIQAIKNATKVRTVDARRQDTDPVMVRVVGDRLSAMKAEQMINDIVEEATNAFADAVYVEVSRRHAALIVGEKGQSVSKTQTDFGVKIDIPCQTDDPTKVYIRGPPSKVAAAKAHLLVVCVAPAYDLEMQILCVPVEAFHILLRKSLRVRHIGAQMGMRIDYESGEEFCRVRINGNAEWMDQCVQGILSFIMEDSPDLADQVTYEEESARSSRASSTMIAM